MVSIKEIARTVNTSISSVSFVLNGKSKSKRISDQLAKRIEEAAERLGYYPNQVAVGLRTGQTKTLGLIVEDISNHFFSSLAKTIENEAKEYGYNVVYCSTENDLKKGKGLLQTLYNQQMDGYLITPVPGMEEDILKLIKHKRPVVLMDGYMKDSEVPYVIVNNFLGMKAGVELLITKGYKNIGYVTINQDKVQISDRRKGWEQTLQEHQLPHSKKYILSVPFETKNEDAVARIQAFLIKNPQLDAVVFATNYLGVFGLKSIRNLNLKIPEHLAVLCFDDNEIFDLHTPSITVIEQPVEQIAKTAVSILMGFLNATTPVNERKILLPVKIIERSST